MNHFDRLPVEIIKHIFSYIEDFLPFVRLTCKTFNTIICTDMYYKDVVKIHKSALYSNDSILLWCKKYYSHKNDDIINITCESAKMKTVELICNNCMFNKNHLLLSIKNNDMHVFEFVFNNILNQINSVEYGYKQYQIDIYNFKIIRQYLSNDEFHRMIENSIYGDNIIFTINIIYEYVMSIEDPKEWINDIDILLSAIGSVIPRNQEQQEKYTNLIIWIITIIDNDATIINKWMDIVATRKDDKYSMLIWDSILLPICKYGKLQEFITIYKCNIIQKSYNLLEKRSNSTRNISRSVMDQLKMSCYGGNIEILNLLHEIFPVEPNTYLLNLLVENACHKYYNGTMNDDNIIHVNIIQGLYNKYYNYFQLTDLEYIISKADTYKYTEFKKWLNSIL
jgi:hypothetical protein